VYSVLVIDKDESKLSHVIVPDAVPLKAAAFTEPADDSEWLGSDVPGVIVEFIW